MGLIPCMTRIFVLVSASTSSANSLTVFVQPLYAIACINICMCVKNIPNTASQTIVWTHENAAHAGRYGWHCSCGCSSLTQVTQPKNPTSDNELLKTKNYLFIFIQETKQQQANKQKR